MTGAVAKAARPALDRAPQLTLPKAEAAFLRKGYEAARVILEYGSGGSTAMAAGMPGKVIWSVESDADWMAGLSDWFARNPPASELHLCHGDVGETGNWGRPKGLKSYAKFHRYPLGVWEEEGFAQPDTVLIDGRFRAACFLAVVYMSTGPVTVYFDDYTGRPSYHTIERFGAPTEIVGRMARFEIEPQPLRPADLRWIMDVFARIQ